MASKQPYTIIVNTEDVEMFDHLVQTFNLFIHKEWNIPWDIVKTFLQIIRDKKVFDDYIVSKKAELITKSALSRLSKIKGYYPESLNKEYHELKDAASKIDTVDDLFEYNFPKFLYVIFLAFLRYEADQKNVPKDDVVYFMYDMVQNYKPFLSKNGKNSYSRYKLYVISGIFVQEAGYQLSGQKKLSNEKIFQAVRNAIKKHDVDKARDNNKK